MVRVVESFVSWQGEGVRTGRICAFLRFKRCNLRCPFCDTMNRIDTMPEYDLDLDQFKKICQSRNVDYLVFTGGEPTLYPDSIQEVMQYFGDNMLYGIETNGYGLLRHKDLLKKDNVEIYWSPKFTFEKEIDQFEKDLKEIYRIYSKNLYLKVVISEYILYDQILSVAVKNIPRNNIYVMCEGSTDLQIRLNLPSTFQVASRYSVNVSTRLHILGLVP